MNIYLSVLITTIIIIIVFLCKKNINTETYDDIEGESLDDISTPNTETNNNCSQQKCNNYFSMKDVVLY